MHAYKLIYIFKRNHVVCTYVGNHVGVPTTTEPLIQGTAGCKNIKSGGDSLHEDGETLGEQVYMTYVVYRSFRFPPPVERVAPSLVVL